jgi:hypothetical protein
MVGAFDECWSFVRAPSVNKGGRVLPTVHCLVAPRSQGKVQALGVHLPHL